MTRPILLVLGFAGMVTTTIASAQQASRTPRPAAAAPRRYSAEERRAAGEAILKHEIEIYGLVEEPAWQRAISDILGRLRFGTADPTLELRPAVLGNPEINASAVPGGVMIINAGLLAWLDSLGRLEVPGNTAGQGQRSRAYLAAVLAHETAHITLHHTDQIIDAMRRQLPLASRDQPVRDPAMLEREIRFDPDTLAAFHRIRSLELAADSMGALYLLRAGWEIQNMMDLLRRLEATEGPGGALVATYLRNHPRGSTREAMLESLRGRLKLNQGRLDDALALINTNTELKLAVALLDSVLVDFPALLAAQHARAAAYHRMWLNTVSVRNLQVRGSLYTYGARILPGIRGAGIPGDTVLHARARAAYQAVLRREELPGTLSNLALLDAYAGRNSAALQGAGRALELVPDDPQLLNNLGVVRFLSGDRAGALDAFRRTLALQGSDEDPAVVFNLGKTQAVLQDPAARATLQGYLGFGERSAWADEAAALLGRAPAAPESTGPAPKPPVVQGVSPGMSGGEVIRVLGPPAGRAQQSQGQIWHYPALGLSVGISWADREEAGLGGHVRFVALLRAEAGEVDGIRVGTSLTVARQRWGWPAERGPSFLLFNRGNWLSGIDYGDPHGAVLRLYAISPK
jgi:predicted Zn-dependent protease